MPTAEVFPHAPTVTQQRTDNSTCPCADSEATIPALMEIYSEFLQQICDSFANVPIKSRFRFFVPLNTPELHYPVLVAGTRVGLSCA